MDRGHRGVEEGAENCSVEVVDYLLESISVFSAGYSKGLRIENP